MRYALAAAIILLASSLPAPADARRESRGRAWYYGSGCHSYYCGDTTRFRTHHYARPRTRYRY